MPLIAGGNVVTVEFNVEDNGATEKVESFNRELEETKQAGSSAGEGADIAQKKMQILGAVVSATTAIIATSYKYYTELAESVRDLSLVSGENAESTSRFIQVLDDFQLTAEDATTAARKLKEQGLSPNIETLAKLSDEFIKIEDPALRLQFVQENLGDAGAKWVNILSKGGDELKRLSGEINENLILSEQQILMHEVQRLAIDDVSDSVDGFKSRLGESVSNVIAYMGAMKRAAEIQGEHTVAVRGGERTTLSFDKAMEMAIAEQLRAAQASIEQGDALKELEIDAKAAEEALKLLGEANKEILSGAMKNTSDMEAFGEKQADFITKLADLQAEKQELKNQGWWEESEKVQDVIAKIDELKGKYAEDAAAYAEAQKEKFAMNAIAAVEMEDGLAGFNEAEYEKARVVAETTGLISESGLEQQYAMQLMTDALLSGAIPSAEQYGAVLNQVMADGVVSVGEVKGAIEGLPNEKTITLNIQTNYSPGTQAALEAFSAGEKGGYSASVPGRASGGSVFAGQAYIVGERGAELFVPQTSGTIIPNGKGGNEEVVAALYATRIDEAKLARLVVEGILKGTR